MSQNGVPAEASGRKRHLWEFDMRWLGLVAALLLAGCTANITPEAIGGSRADGTIVEAYQFGAFEKPVVDWDAADADAKTRCHEWGYNNADRFAGVETQCLERNGYGMCMQSEVHATYQCTEPTPSP
jgi:hypothetical protein